MLKWRQCCPKQMTAVGVSVMLHAGVLVALSQNLQTLVPIPKTAATISVQMIAASSPTELPPVVSSPAVTQAITKLNNSRTAAAQRMHKPASTPSSLQGVAEINHQQTSKPSVSKMPELIRPVVANNTITNVTPQVQQITSQRTTGATKPQAAELVTLDELAVICAYRPTPTYPRSSRRLRESGIVHIKVWISALGTVEKSAIVQSSGYLRLDNAALETVNRWRCKPPVHNGLPTPTVAMQPFHFGLNN